MATYDYERFVFDTTGTPLDLSALGYTIEEMDWKPAKKILDWVKNADSDGAKLLRVPKLGERHHRNDGAGEPGRHPRIWR